MICQLATTRLEVCKALDALPYLGALSFGSGIDKAGALSPLKDYTKADRLPFHTDLNPPLGPVMGAASCQPDPCLALSCLPWSKLP